MTGKQSDDPDAGTVTRRLESVEQYLEYLRETTPYYEWLDPEIVTVERGLVRGRIENAERTAPPEVGPTEGINGGVVLTIADAVGMAAIIAEVLEPIPLATTDVNLRFHDGAASDYLGEGAALNVGSTLATTALRVYAGDPDGDLLASGGASARLFE